MTNKKGEFTTQGMIISILLVGLFFGVIGGIITGVSNYYDTTGYEENGTIASFNHVQNISETVNQTKYDLQTITVENSWFDFFSGIWSKILRPVNFILSSVGHIFTMIGTATAVFKLLPIFTDFFVSVIIVLVFIGLLLIKFLAGRKK